LAVLLATVHFGHPVTLRGRPPNDFPSQQTLLALVPQGSIMHKDLPAMTGLTAVTTVHDLTDDPNTCNSLPSHRMSSQFHRTAATGLTQYCYKIHLFHCKPSIPNSISKTTTTPLCNTPHLPPFSCRAVAVLPPAPSATQYCTSPQPTYTMLNMLL
jgi:hypothetical protein